MCENSTIFEYANFSTSRVGQSPVLKKSIILFSHIFAHSPFLKEQLCDRSFYSGKKCNFEIGTLLHIFAHSLLAKEQLCDCIFLHFFKEWQKVRLYSTFAYFWRATKNVIAHSHIFKEQHKKRSHICTFSKSENVRLCDCPTRTWSWSREQEKGRQGAGSGSKHREQGKEHASVPLKEEQVARVGSKRREQEQGARVGSRSREQEQGEREGTESREQEQRDVAGRGQLPIVPCCSCSF